MFTIVIVTLIYNRHKPMESIDFLNLINVLHAGHLQAAGARQFFTRRQREAMLLN
jgi:hypothetical protein